MFFQGFEYLLPRFAVSMPAIKGLISLKPLLSGLVKDSQEKGLLNIVVSGKTQPTLMTIIQSLDSAGAQYHSHQDITIGVELMSYLTNTNPFRTLNK